MDNNERRNSAQVRGAQPNSPRPAQGKHGMVRSDPEAPYDPASQFVHDRAVNLYRRRQRARDARIAAGKKRSGAFPVIVLAAILALCCLIPGLVTRLNRRAANTEGGTIVLTQDDIDRSIGVGGYQSNVYIQDAPTAEPQVTQEPEDPGVFISEYTGRTLNRSRPAVALVFMDGPGNHTGDILDSLAKFGGLATFFPVGERVRPYAEAVQRAAEMGCLIGSHLYTHTALSDMQREDIEGELERCAEAHMAVLGEVPAIYAPPNGETTEEASEIIGTPLIAWSLNSDDWEVADADKIYNKVVNELQDGDIVLFHDLKECTAQAVERIVTTLNINGVQMVTVQELFELKGQTLENGVLYAQRVEMASAEEMLLQSDE